jgi:hypothetical protein
MRESQFGFEYSWSDLKPVWPLALTVLIGQLGGAALGYYVAKNPSAFANIWAGGALATFPCFLIGILIQWLRNAAALNENRVMVRRLGLIALVLSLAVFVMPLEAM